MGSFENLRSSRSWNGMMHKEREVGHSVELSHIFQFARFCICVVRVTSVGLNRSAVPPKLLSSQSRLDR